MKVPFTKYAESLKNIIIAQFIPDSNATVAVYDKLKEKYNMPMNRAKDIMTLSSVLTKFNEFDLFCVGDCLAEVNPDINNLVERFYTEDEIKKYRVSHYNEDKVTFPYKINQMIMVRDGQYIGKLTAKGFRSLDNAALINYNENTQRVMERIVNGSKVTYKISINRTAVNEIKDLMRKGAYFPDPITLNIPVDDVDNVFQYNEKDFTLTISKLKRFDILDGYHRFVAMRELIEENSDFDYVMELRVVNWDEGQAQQFIYQQDQGTKMSHTDSNTYNQYAGANRVAERLNVSMYGIAGKINRNDGQISLTDFTTALSRIWFKKDSVEDQRKLIVTLPKEIGSKFDLLFASDEKYEKMRYDFKTLYIILTLISLEISDEKFIPTLEEALEAMKDYSITAKTRNRKFTIEFNKFLENINK